jgi:hypothetical protein
MLRVLITCDIVLLLSNSLIIIKLKVFLLNDSNEKTSATSVTLQRLKYKSLKLPLT